MFKKILKSFIVSSFAILLLSGCGKKQLTTSEVYESSLANFNQASNYTLNMNLGFNVSSGGNSFITIKTSPSYKVDNVSKNVLKKDKTSMFLLFFGDDSENLVYEDFNNKIKYTVDSETGEIVKEELSSQSNPSYVMNVFLSNGVLVGQEYTEYSSDKGDFYVVPLRMNYDTLTTMFSSFDKEELEEAAESSSLSIPELTDAQKEELKDIYLDFDYLVYKDTLLPAMINIETNSLMDFCSKLSKVLGETESMQTLSTGDADFTVSIDDFNVSIGNYNMEETVSIPDDIVKNAVEKKEEDYSFSSDFSSDEIVEDDSFVEDEEVIEIPEFEFKDFDEKYFSFRTNDENTITFPCRVSDLIDAGYEVILPEEDVLKPNKYSVPVEVKSGEDVFYITAMNDSTEDMNFSDCYIIRAEFDALDFNNELVVSDDITFDSDLRDLKFDFDDESFLYEGELSTIYTYQYEESKYIVYQVDDETGKVCFISMTYM